MYFCSDFPVSFNRNSVASLTSSLWMARIRSLAASQLLFLPVMTIISELLFSVGRSILVLVSSRIWWHWQHLSFCALQYCNICSGCCIEERHSSSLYVIQSFTFLMLAPPLPIMFLWNCLKMGTESEKLFSICKRKTAAVKSSAERCRGIKRLWQR